MARRPRKVQQLLEKADFVQKNLNFATGSIGSSFGFDEIQEALDKFSLNPYLGLYTLVVDGATRVPSATQLTCSTELSAFGTYVLVGGLGGIGRTIAELLVVRGAKHIAFLSRSGATETSTSFLGSLRRKGVDARAFAVDICNYRMLIATMGTLEKEMPRIRGAVQCAAVVEVSLATSSPFLVNLSTNSYARRTPHLPRWTTPNGTSHLRRRPRVHGTSTVRSPKTWTFSCFCQVRPA